jgi:hypothetical protein
MDFEVLNIHSTSEDTADLDYDPEKGYTDVIVTLTTGEKFIAPFYSYNSIEFLVQQNMISGEFLNGKYLWAKNMIMVKDCTLNTISLVVDDLIDEGNFFQAFRLL